MSVNIPEVVNRKLTPATSVCNLPHRIEVLGETSPNVEGSGGQTPIPDPPLCLHWQNLEMDRMELVGTK